MKEWGAISGWYCSHRMATPQVRWMIQIPRVYRVWKKIGMIKCFQVGTAWCGAA